jgi:hypothetical protein
MAYFMLIFPASVVFPSPRIEGCYIMKSSFLKNTTVALSLFVSTGFIGNVFAHDQIGSLGKAAGATDLYEVTCFDDGTGTGGTHHLTSSVLTGIAPTNLRVSVRTQKDAKATNSTDAVNGNSVGSPLVDTVAGDGIYYLSVGKTVASTTATPYTADFHCENSTGGHTGTSSKLLQNQ